MAKSTSKKKKSADAATELANRVRTIIRRLKKTYPQAKCSLNHRDPYQLLVSTILSAQCTDEQVNKVAPALFKKYPTAAAMAKSNLAALETMIRSTGFYRNKAKNIRAACRTILEEFGGNVPSTMEELLRLSGVARKTANVVLWNAFGKNEGIAVDTHVTRLTNRMELTQTKDPKKIETGLLPLVPKRDWGQFTHIFIDHGRAVCQARNPKCAECVVNDLCPSSTV